MRGALLFMFIENRVRGYFLSCSHTLSIPIPSETPTSLKELTPWAVVLIDLINLIPSSPLARKSNHTTQTVSPLPLDFLILKGNLSQLDSLLLGCPKWCRPLLGIRVRGWALPHPFPWSFWELQAPYPGKRLPGKGVFRQRKPP